MSSAKSFIQLFLEADSVSHKISLHKIVKNIKLKVLLNLMKDSKYFQVLF